MSETAMKWNQAKRLGKALLLIADAIELQRSVASEQGAMGVGLISATDELNKGKDVLIREIAALLNTLPPLPEAMGALYNKTYETL